MIQFGEHSHDIHGWTLSTGMINTWNLQITCLQTTHTLYVQNRLNTIFVEFIIKVDSVVISAFQILDWSQTWLLILNCFLKASSVKCLANIWQMVKTNKAIVHWNFSILNNIQWNFHWVPMKIKLLCTLKCLYNFNLFNSFQLRR